jgi:hypothetical protein
MWILDWLPFWIFHLIVLAGLAGLAASFVLKFIPFVSTYKLPIQVAAIATLVFGFYMEGGISNQEKWEARVAELEEKVKVSEAKSKTANVQIQTVYKDKVKIVKETQVVIQEKIKEVEKLIDAQCTIDNSVIDILNDAAVRKK